jgi:hypothetical protein
MVQTWAAMDKALVVVDLKVPDQDGNRSRAEGRSDYGPMQVTGQWVR